MVIKSRMWSKWLIGTLMIIGACFVGNALAVILGALGGILIDRGFDDFRKWNPRP